MNKFINIIFIILWGLAILIFGIIILLILSPYIDTSTYITLTPDEKEKMIKHITTLLVPLGVLISAALASTSVIKSIVNTNKIEENKSKQNSKNAEKYMKSIYNDISLSFLGLKKTGLLLQKIKDFELDKMNKNFSQENLNEEQKEFIISIRPTKNNTIIISELEQTFQLLEIALKKLDDKDLIYYLSEKHDIFKTRSSFIESMSGMKHIIEIHNSIVLSRKVSIDSLIYYIKYMKFLDNTIKASNSYIKLKIQHKDNKK